MSQERIVWTVLPNGLTVKGGKKYLRLTVAASPRCYGPGTSLSSYHAFLHWPASLAHAKFKVLFHGSGGPKLVTARRDPDSPKAEQAKWGYLFTGVTPVNPYHFQDYSQRFIINDPATMIHDFVRGTYQSIIATSPNGLPEVAGGTAGGTKGKPGLAQTLAGANFPNGFPTVAELKRELSALKDKQQKTLPPATTGSTSLTQLDLFYQRNWEPITPWPTTPQTLDFHEQVSSLTKFGDLQRYLGLAIDLLVPLSPGIPKSGTTTVQLQTPVLLDAPHDINPQTHYTLTSTQFLPKSSTGEVKRGMLDLSNPALFNLVQIDTDGAGLKLIGLIKQLLTSEDFVLTAQARTGQPELIGLPSLRSGGLAVLQTGRDVDLAESFPRATSANTSAEGGTGGSLKFHAEDLVRGFRVDIWDSFTHKWHSLHERGPAIDPTDRPKKVPPKKLPGTYTFVNAPAGHKHFTPKGLDEGFVSMALTQDPNGPSSGGNSPDLYLHELLWRWMGWSLSGQRPNMYLGTDDSPTQYGDQPSDTEPGPGVALVTHFGAADGSLPKLRFGRGYRLRARVVDLAGNSLPPTSPLADYEAPKKSAKPLTYRRFEPVVTPAVVPHDDLSTYDGTTSQLVGSSPGESNFRLVVRSNYNMTADQELAYLSGTGAGDLAYVHLPPQTTRWIAPPRMSQIMAEHHGLFDHGAGWRADALHLMTTYDNSFGVETLPDGTTVPIAHGGKSLPLPYLPDVLAAGATFAGLPGAGPVFGPKKTLPNPAQSLTFTGKWPAFKPFRLTLVGIDSGAKAPRWNPTHRILTVYLPKAGTATTQLSSFLAPKDLNLLGIWGWMDEYEAAGKITPTRLKIMARFAAAGLMWALTPFLSLTFVNAVQQPLVLPQFTSLTSLRDTPGQTDALLCASPMTIDGPSTIKVDISADWVDPRDDPAVDPCPQPNTTDPNPPYGTVPGLPKEIASSQHVLEIPVAPTDPDIKFDTVTNYRHKFGDTKHRFVKYTATATTRFLEYFPRDSRIETTRVSPVATVNILSSARPQAPNILYAIPAFGWTNSQSGTITKTERTGGWLRVYMDRPFYSSGEGELLGIVLINNANQVDVLKHGRVKRALAAHGLAKRDASGVTTVLEKYVTQWGMDPLWDSPGIQNPPMASDFPTAATNSIPLYLDELGGSAGPRHAGGVPVSVAGFPVTYDQDRCLYFADLQFNWGDSYYPFVRLALASYQPNSIASPDTVHLSRVIMTDFVQLAPNRVAEILTHSNAKDPNFVKVAVVGVTYANGFGSGQGTEMEVTLEQQAPEIQPSSDELSWVPVPNADYVLTPTKILNSDTTVWSAGFDLPHPAGSVPYRLILREYELYPREWGQYVPPSSPSSQRDAARRDATRRAFDRRLVYAATLQI